MLSQWTTTTNWTDSGAPYLWWTGADDAPDPGATVQWGLSSGRLGHGKKVGVVVSDQASDQDALNSYLLPDLKKIGVDPQVVTVTADVGETASTDSDATLAVERLKSAGRPVGDSPAARERVHALHRRRDVAGLLPQAPAQRLPVRD
jgi:hypothetical protein